VPPVPAGPVGSGAGAPLAGAVAGGASATPVRPLAPADPGIVLPRMTFGRPLLETAGPSSAAKNISRTPSTRPARRTPASTPRRMTLGSVPLGWARPERVATRDSDSRRTV
jgi:hypothetical protein